MVILQDFLERVLSESPSDNESDHFLLVADLNIPSHSHTVQQTINLNSYIVKYD